MTSSKLATAADTIVTLASRASDNGTVDAFLASREWALFLLDAEAAGYLYSELETPLNGYSVRNAADQAFQFACSVEQNESAPDTVAARAADAAREVAIAEARANAQLANTAAGRDYAATVARWKAEGFEVNEEVVAPEPYSHGGQRVASIYQGSGYGHQHAFLSIRLVIARTSKQRTTVRRYAATEKGKVSYADGARWLGILAEHGTKFRSAAARAEAAAVVALPVPPRLVSTTVEGVVEAAPDAGHPDVRVEIATTAWAHPDGTVTSSTARRILGSVEPVEAAVVAPEPEPEPEPEEPEALDTVGFIIAAEEGTLTEEQFEASAQRFVDSGVWRALQGSWLRTVLGWADAGLVTI